MKKNKEIVLNGSDFVFVIFVGFALWETIFTWLPKHAQNAATI